MPRTLLVALTLLVAPLTANAQPIWTVGGATSTLRTTSDADDPNDMAPPCSLADAQNGINFPFLGHSGGNRAFTGCGILVVTCPLKAVGLSQVFVDGLGTNTVTIEWRTYAWVLNKCDRLYIARATSEIMTELRLVPAGLPNGTAVTINYRWNGLSENNSFSEAGVEDTGSVTGTQLLLNGGDLTLSFFDLPGINGLRVKSDQYGSTAGVVGNDTIINVNGSLENSINNPPILPTVFDFGISSFSGSMTLALNAPPPPPVAPATPPALEFGIDIGGDTEISDFNLDADAAFDPGDTYPWYGPALPPGGANGMRDDNALFGGGFDPPPSAPNPPVTGPPACAGGPPQPVIPLFFDLSDFDAINLDLSVLINPGAPLPAPFATQPSPCLFGPDHLAVSYDDDTTDHYISSPTPPCSIPMFDLSPTFDTYGQSGRRDEIVAIELIALTLTSSTIVGSGPALAEDRLHVSLAPNPDINQGDDDDVDGLDIYDDPAICDNWYFTADHEATWNHPLLGGALNPGVIYQAVPGGPPVPVIDPTIHLGLHAGVDIDAFEFVLLKDPTSPSGSSFLAIIFSVNDNDPLTPDDESAGLNPRVLYASFLDGAFFDLTGTPLDDDIDALTAYRLPFSTYTTPITPPAPCPGDANGDRVVNGADLSVLLGQFGQPVPPGTGADFNNDGIVNGADLSVLLSNFGNVCP